jgi:hypothetical protein
MRIAEPDRTLFGKEEVEGRLVDGHRGDGRGEGEGEIGGRAYMDVVGVPHDRWALG